MTLSRAMRLAEPRDDRPRCSTRRSIRAPRFRYEAQALQDPTSSTLGYVRRCRWVPVAEGASPEPGVNVLEDGDAGRTRTSKCRSRERLGAMYSLITGAVDGVLSAERLLEGIDSELNLPFDLRHHRFIRYLGNDEGLADLKRSLSSRLHTLMRP